MIANSTSSSLYSANYLNINQSVTIKSHKENNQNNDQNNILSISDQVNISYSVEKYSSYNKTLSLERTAEDGYDLLRGLVLNMFREQGLDYKIKTDDAEIDLSTVTPEEAQELVSDDGFFGVEKTAERIVSFAVGMAGGDTTRIDAIRQGVEAGFQEALDAFGGWLPDISYQTYDTVMQKLDDWINDTNPEPQN